jgi:hypothetical protein
LVLFVQKENRRDHELVAKQLDRPQILSPASRPSRDKLLNC